MDELLAKWSGWTPLHMSSFGNEPDSHLIYDSLNEVDKLDESGRSPLQIAIENQNSSMISILVKHGASFDHVEINGIKGERLFEHHHYFELGIQLLPTVPMSPKFLALASSYAGYTDQPELTELITRNKSFCRSVFNSYDLLGLTPVHYASIKGSSTCASIMIDNGGVITKWSKTDFSYPVHYAFSHGHEDMIELFQHSSPDDLAETIDSQDVRGRTPFHSALYGRQWKLLSSFSSLLQSCDSSLLDFDGHSVPGLLFLMRTSCMIPREFSTSIPCLTQDESDWMLHAAISDGDDDLLRFALEQNANVNCLDLMQQSPIISAAKLGHSVMCLLLLENGADQSIGDYNGYTALHYSSRNGHIEVTKTLLLFPGSDSLSLSVNEYTPLDLAFIGNHLDVACELLQSMKQVSLNILPHWIKTLELAMSCANESILRHLVCHLPSNWMTRLIVNPEGEIERQVAIPSMAHRLVDCPVLRKYVPFPSLSKLFASDVKNVLKVRQKHKEHIEDAKYHKHKPFQSIFEFQKQSKNAFRMKHRKAHRYFPIHEALNAKNRDAFLFLFKAARDVGLVEKFLTSKGASRISVAQRLSSADMPDVISECNLENKLYQCLLKVFLDSSEMTFPLSLLHHIVSDRFISKKAVTYHSKICRWPDWFLRKHLKEFCISVGIFDDLSLNDLGHVIQLVQKILENNHLSHVSNEDVSLLLYSAVANGVSPLIFEILLEGLKCFNLSAEAFSRKWAFTEAIRRNHYDLARLLLVHVYDNSLCSKQDDDDEFMEEVMFSFQHISSSREFDFALQVLKSFSKEWLSVFLFGVRYGERLLYLYLSSGEVSELGSFLIGKYFVMLHTVVSEEIDYYYKTSNAIVMIPVTIDQTYRNYPSCRGNSPLELLDKLVKLCKSIKWNSLCPSSVLCRVCGQGEADVLKAIMECDSLQSSDFLSNEEGFTPLYCAIVGGHLDIVNMILTKYPSALDDQNTTCLLGALFHFCYSNYIRNTKYFKGVLERFEEDWAPVDVSVNIHNADPSFSQDFLQLCIADNTNINIHEKFADWLVCLILHVPNISSVITCLEDNFVKTIFEKTQQSWFFSTTKYTDGLQNFSDWVLNDAFWFNASRFNEEFAHLLENLFSRFPPFNPFIAVRKGYHKSLVQGVTFLNDFAHAHAAYESILKNWLLAVIDIIKLGEGELAITILKKLTVIDTFNQQAVFDLEKLLKVSVQVPCKNGFSSNLLEYLLEFQPQAKTLLNTFKYAARKGNVEAIKVLAAYDRCVIESSFTAILHSASESGQSGIVDYFYENRFYDFLKENLAYYHSLDVTFWMTVFQDAVHSGQKELALYALGKLPFSAMASLAGSADTIHDICWWGMADVLTTLCIDDTQVFFNETYIDLYGCSPFQAALDSGHVGVMAECESFPLFIDVLSSPDIELMLENSLDEFDLTTRFSYGWLNINVINDNEENKECPLQASYAVQKCVFKKLPNLCYFLEHLAVVNGYSIVNSYIRTWGKHASGVLYYLYKKHSINVLELAADGGCIQTIQTILQLLFDAQVLNKLTSLEMFQKALVKNNVEILKLLKQFCDEQIVMELKNDYEETILHIISEYSQSSQCSEVLLSMIKSHLPRLSNCANIDGMNPLSCAINLGRFYVAREIMSFTAHIVSLEYILSRGIGWFSLLMEYNATNMLQSENSQLIDTMNAFNELPSLRDKEVSEYYKAFKNYHPGIAESIMTASCDALPLHGLDYTDSSTLMGYEFSTKTIKWSRNQLMVCMRRCELLNWCKKRQFQCVINVLGYIISNDEIDLLDAASINQLFVTACSKDGLSLVKYMLNCKDALVAEKMLPSSTLVDGFVTAIGLGYLEIAAYIMLNGGVSQRVLQKELFSTCEPSFLVNLIFFTPVMDVIRILQNVIEQGVSSRSLASQTWLMHNWGQYQIELVEKRMSRASLHSQQFEVELSESQRFSLCVDLTCFPDIETVSCPFPKLAVVVSACVSHLVPIWDSQPLFPLMNVPEDGTLTLSYDPYSTSPRYDTSSYNNSIVLVLDKLNQLFVWPLSSPTSPNNSLDVKSVGLVEHLFTIPCKELMEMSCEFHILKAKLPIPVNINLDSIGISSCSQSLLNALMQCVNDTLNTVNLYYYKYALYTELGLISKDFLDDYQYKSFPMKSPLTKLLTNLSIEIDCSADTSEVVADLDSTGNLKAYIGIENDSNEVSICPSHYQITEAVGSLLVKADLAKLSNELSLYLKNQPYSFTVCSSSVDEDITDLGIPSELVLKDIVILRFLPYIKRFISLLTSTFTSCSVPTSGMNCIKIFFDISLHSSYFDARDNSLKITIFDLLPHRRKEVLACVVPVFMKSVHSAGLYSATAVSSYIDISENLDFFLSRESGIARICNLQGEIMETVPLKCVKDPNEKHLYRASAVVGGDHVRNSPLVFQWKPQHHIQFIVTHPGGGCGQQTSPFVIMNRNYKSIRERIPVLKGMPSKTTSLQGKDEHTDCVYGKEIAMVFVPGSLCYVLLKNNELNKETCCTSKCLPMARGMYQVILESDNSFMGSVVAVCSMCECNLRIHTNNGYSFSQDIKFPSGPISFNRSYMENGQLHVMAGSGLVQGRIVLRDNHRNDCTLDANDDIPQVILQYGTEMITCTTELVSASVISITMPPLYITGKYPLQMTLNDTSRQVGTVIVRSGKPHPPNCTIKGTTLVDGRHVLKTDISTDIIMTVALFDEYGNSCDPLAYCDSVSAKAFGADQFKKFKVSASKKRNEIVLCQSVNDMSFTSVVVKVMNQPIPNMPITLEYSFTELSFVQRCSMLFTFCNKMSKGHESCVITWDGSLNTAMEMLSDMCVARPVEVVEKKSNKDNLTMKFFTELTKDIVDSQHWLFSCTTANGLYRPLPQSFPSSRLEYFEFVGRMLAKAIAQGCYIEVKFSVGVYKTILGESFTMKDMEKEDIALYRCLERMTECSCQNEFLKVVRESKLANAKFKTLIDSLMKERNESYISFETRDVYINRFVQIYLYESMEQQLLAIKRGFLSVIPQNILYFNHEELKTILTGNNAVNVARLKSKAVYLRCKETDKAVVCLWKVISNLNEKELVALLQTSTGYISIPLSNSWVWPVYGDSYFCRFRTLALNSNGVELPLILTSEKDLHQQLMTCFKLKTKTRSKTQM